MRIGTALLTAACVISGIVVIESHSAYAAGLTAHAEDVAASPQPSSDDAGPAAEI